jgi:uncharacterized protein (TIGR03437 family)
LSSDSRWACQPRALVSLLHRGPEYEIPGPERVRKVSPSGIITTVAGGGSALPVDGGPAASAILNGPTGLAADSAGNVYVADTYTHVVRILRPINQSVLTVAVADAASQRANPVSPGKIVVIYGAGLGPSDLVRNQPRDNQFSMELAGTTVSFNGIAAPILYTSATQVAAVAPYALTGSTAQVAVTYLGETSNSFTVPVAASAPSLFTLNHTGAGQAAAINAVDATVNTADNPVKLGRFISLYAIGEGQTTPAGVDGRIAGPTLPRPVLPVRVTVGGIPATVQCAGGAPGQVDTLPFPLTHLVAFMPRRTSINRAAARTLGVLRNMRRHVHAPHLTHELVGVVCFIGSQRDAGEARYNQLREHIMTLTECFKRTAQLAITEACQQGWIVAVKGRYRSLV